MTELIKNLTEAGDMHKGSDLGALLQWAVLHIQAQDEALAEARKELEDKAIMAHHGVEQYAKKKVTA